MQTEVFVRSGDVGAAWSEVRGWHEVPQLAATPF